MMLTITALFHATTPSVSRCIISPHVDRHVVRSAMDASITPVVGWIISPGCATLQSKFSYNMVAAAPTAGPIIAFEGLNQSEGIIWPTAQKSLAYGTVYDFFATVTFANGVVAEGSTTFLTELDPSTLAAAQPMWHANDSATYVLLRASITAAAEANTLGGGEQHTYLTITAKPAPAWNMPHGVNSSHLLCSYKLWVNGVPLGVGPGRNVGGEIQADTYNLTALLALRGGGEASAIAVSAYYLAHGATPDGGSGQPQSTDDHGGVLAVLHSGSDATGNVGANIRTLEWSAFDATIATHPSIGTFKHGDGTGSYLSPRENYLGAHYPFGWRQQLPSQTDAYKHGWSPAKARAPFARMVGPKRAIPVSLRAIPAASFTMLPPATPMTYRYIIDYGRNFQGHVNLSFGSANIVPGHQVIVRLGEQLLTNGSVKWVSESTNRWNDVWTLRGGSRNLPSSSSSASAAAQQLLPLETYVPHEYAEFRWAEVIDAPEPPTHALLAGWQVHYAFDGEMNENGLVVAPAMSAYSVPSATNGLTSFDATDADLVAVWDLVKHTINVAALDLNTDSNTRQRDLCTLDAWLATRWQSGVAPASSSHIRRRATQIMWELNGYVNVWSEFLVAHIGALHDYTMDYGDDALLRDIWNNTFMCPKTQGNAFPQDKNHYMLAAYFNASSSMIQDSPRPLIDWPRSSGIDTDNMASHQCDHLCVQMNAYASKAHRWAADLAELLGDDDSAKNFAIRGEAIRKAAQSAFKTTTCYTVPPPAPTPGPLPPSAPIVTCGVEWEKDTPMHHHNSTGTLQLNCGAGKVISSIDFADFGLAIGDCASGNGFKQNASCHNREDLDVRFIEPFCLHKQWCVLNAKATKGGFEDKCKGLCKRLTVSVTCSKVGAGAEAEMAPVSGKDAMMCYSDSGTTFTSATASATAAYANLPNRATDVLALVPFLAARNGRRGPLHGLEVSGWMAGFMMEGLYRAAGTISEGALPLSLVEAAATYAHSVLTNQGDNSWLGMIRQNATMTMEAWTQPPYTSEGGGTFSHPWTASPAYIIPRFLMGVRPLDTGWRRVAIRPLPPRSAHLTSASIVVPTMRGDVGLAWSLNSNGTFTATVTVPGNTVAQLCLPRYLIGSAKDASTRCTIRDSTGAAHALLHGGESGGLACVAQDLPPGVHHAELACA